MLALRILALTLDDGFVDTDDGRACSHGCEKTKDHFCFLDVIMVVPLLITLVVSEMVVEFWLCCDS